VRPIDVLQRWAPRYARIAIAAAFLSAVAGRFGLWTGQVRWDAFERFIARTAELNAWAPRFMIPVLAWSATVAETTLALALIAGVGVRWAAFGSAALLAWFATAMLVYTGLKPPLDYSVYSASACALLLALHERRRTEHPVASGNTPRSHHHENQRASLSSHLNAAGVAPNSVMRGFRFPPTMSIVSCTGQKYVRCRLGDVLRSLAVRNAPNGALTNNRSRSLMAFHGRTPQANVLDQGRRWPRA
jgi:uncharacterized membrane protein YphA (DoxX/SURF4 family)